MTDLYVRKEYQSLNLGDAESMVGSTHLGENC